MNMTKQQAISLRLAQWLGNKGAMIEHGEVYINDFTGRPFNPFASTTEGRAQFAECVIKCCLDRGDHAGLDMCRNYVRTGWDSALQRFSHDNTEQGFVAATIEAIYYAIGGVRECEE